MSILEGTGAAVLEGSSSRAANWSVSGQHDVGQIRFAPAFAPRGGALKRCFDVLLSIVLLPLAVLVFLPIACAIAVSGGVPIYGQLRVGWNGRIFRCYKFRTMVVEAEVELHRLFARDPEARLRWLEDFKLVNDPRVTRLGRILRWTNLDELPQIWNVLRGEMSFVGPRPVVPEELSKYSASASAYLACRPGITGLWQISRRGGTTYDERVAFDVDYERHWSFARDIVILVRTVPWIFVARTRA